MSDHYLFIDGRYVDLAYRDHMQSFFGSDGDLDVREVIRHTKNPQRIYFYAAVDDELRPNEKPEELDQRVAQQLARFDSISSIDACHVRLGTITGRALRKRRQKQVDVQLAVDALLHTFHKNISRVTLIAGDLDFKPLVDALVSLGVHTRVVYARRSAAKDLYRAADFAEEMTLLMAYRWSSLAFRAAHPLPEPLPSSETNTFPPGTHERIGTFEGRETRLVRISQPNGPDQFRLCVIGRPGRDGFGAYAYDRNLLLKYFEYEFGAPEWTDIAVA